MNRRPERVRSCTFTTRNVTSVQTGDVLKPSLGVDRDLCGITGRDRSSVVVDGEERGTARVHEPFSERPRHSRRARSIGFGTRVSVVPYYSLLSIHVFTDFGFTDERGGVIGGQN